MAEINALIEEIARNPLADVPRWRAAAWYEGQGDFDRAAFIRMQLQLARLPNRVDSPEWFPLIEESQRLLARHYDAWRNIQQPGRHRRTTMQSTARVPRLETLHGEPCRALAEDSSRPPLTLA
jgi:uncharacterized protein (TIGR02996 family)